MDILYENIKRRRLELGLTQLDLAKRLGYNDKSTIAKIEKGNTDLSVSKLISFAKALNTTPLKLIGAENASPLVDYLVLSADEQFIVDTYSRSDDAEKKLLLAYFKALSEAQNKK